MRNFLEFLRHISPQLIVRAAKGTDLYCKYFGGRTVRTEFHLTNGESEAMIARFAGKNVEIVKRNIDLSAESVAVVENIEGREQSVIEKFQNQRFSENAGSDVFSQNYAYASGQVLNIGEWFHNNTKVCDDNHMDKILFNSSKNTIRVCENQNQIKCITAVPQNFSQPSIDQRSKKQIEEKTINEINTSFELPGSIKESPIKLDQIFAETQQCESHPIEFQTAQSRQHPSSIDIASEPFKPTLETQIPSKYPNYTLNESDVFKIADLRPNMSEERQMTGDHSPSKSVDKNLEQSFNHTKLWSKTNASFRCATPKPVSPRSAINGPVFNELAERIPKKEDNLCSVGVEQSFIRTKPRSTVNESFHCKISTPISPASIIDKPVFNEFNKPNAKAEEHILNVLSSEQSPETTKPSGMVNGSSQCDISNPMSSMPAVDKPVVIELDKLIPKGEENNRAPRQTREAILNENIFSKPNNEVIEKVVNCQRTPEINYTKSSNPVDSKKDIHEFELNEIHSDENSDQKSVFGEAFKSVENHAILPYLGSDDIDSDENLFHNRQYHSNNGIITNKNVANNVENVNVLTNQLDYGYQSYRAEAVASRYFFSSKLRRVQPKNVQENWQRLRLQTETYEPHNNEKLLKSVQLFDTRPQIQSVADNSIQIKHSNLLSKFFSIFSTEKPDQSDLKDSINEIHQGESIENETENRVIAQISERQTSDYPQPSRVWEVSKQNVYEKHSKSSALECLAKIKKVEVREAWLRFCRGPKRNTKAFHNVDARDLYKLTKTFEPLVEHELVEKMQKASLTAAKIQLRSGTKIEPIKIAENGPVEKVTRRSSARIRYDVLLI